MDIPFLTHRQGSGPDTPRRKAAPLGLDFHNHLLPGVDDGLATIDETKEAIFALRAAGFNGAVMTPHIYKEVFDNTAALLRKKYESIVLELSADLHEFPLYLAAEYFADEHFLKLVAQDDLLYIPIGGERWVLVEFPYFQESPYGEECLFAMTARGYRPVIAHVERYRYVAAAPGLWLNRFERVRAILQGDIGSLAGQHGSRVRRFAEWLAARNLLVLWGSDLHRPSQMQRYILPGLRQLPGRLNSVLEPLASVPSGPTIVTTETKVL
jgi:tyrosine-protein phosphatase YwqE